MSVRASLFGLSVDEMSQTEAVETIQGIWRRGAKSRVFFVNAHCLNTASNCAEYRESLRRAEFLLPDGSGVLLASRMLHLPIRHNLNGTDLTPLLLKAAEEDGCSVFLLGARPGIADLAAASLRQRYPGLRIVGAQHGYFLPEETPAIIRRINAAQPDILLVAMGVPTQELWITQHYNELQVPVNLAVGALFDFLSNSVPRAPLVVRKVGMEWAFRLVCEPRRLWKRYLVGNFSFLFRVMAMRTGLKQAPAPVAVQMAMPESGMRTHVPMRITSATASYPRIPVPERGNIRWSAPPVRRGKAPTVRLQSLASLRAERRAAVPGSTPGTVEREPVPVSR